MKYYSLNNPQRVAEAMRQVVKDAGYEFDIHVSPINSQGIKVL